VAVKIRDKFRKMGYPDARLDSFNITRTWKSVVYSMKQYNVIAELRGSRYPDSLMILGGHYDSVLGPGDPFLSAPGADDNASGTAALLEIARVMKTNNYKPLSGIQFVAFGAEELGLLGSYDYAGRIGPSGRFVKLMINNDMIGYVSESNPSWNVNIITYSNAIELLEKSKSMCRFYTSLNYTNDNANYNRSDSYPFYVNNYKAVFFMSESLNPYYHSINDTFDKYNFDFCTEVASLSCALLVWSDTHEL
jgi:leucyl aminopeptidase